MYFTSRSSSSSSSAGKSKYRRCWVVAAQAEPGRFLIEKSSEGHTCEASLNLWFCTCGIGESVVPVLGLMSGCGEREEIIVRVYAVKTA